jgi:hypothetical protein
MKTIKKLGQGVLVAIAVVGLAGTASAAPKSINSCKTIDEPGSYIVTKNLTTSGQCLGVAASNVTIDLGGHVLSGGGISYGVVANNSRTGITVRNGTVTGFFNGIHLQGPGNIVEQIRAHDNAWSGIVVGPGSLVRSSVAYGNGEYGIAAGVASHVTGNLATGNDFGIGLWCPASAVANTTVDNISFNLASGAGCFSSQNLAP